MAEMLLNIKHFQMLLDNIWCCHLVAHSEMLLDDIRFFLWHYDRIKCYTLVLPYNFSDYYMKDWLIKTNSQKNIETLIKQARL